MFRSSSQQGIQGFVRFVIAVPWLTVLLAVAAAGVALWYTMSALEFETSRDVLASSHARYIQLKNEIKEDFDDTDYLVVVIEPPNVARGKQFVQALVPRLRADTRHFHDVVARIDTTSLDGKKLLLLSPEELRALRQRLDEAQDFVFDLSQTPGVVPLLTAINQEISKALVSFLTSGLLGLSPAASASTAPAAAQSLDVSFLGALFTRNAEQVAGLDCDAC